MNNAMNSMVRLLAVPILGLALAGCQSPPKVQSEADPDANLSAYKSFALLPLPDRVPGADPGVMLRVGKPLSQEVSAALKAKGYTEAEAKSADFAVKLAGKVVPKVDVTDWGYSHAPGGWMRRYPYAYGQRDVTVDSYEEGTLTLEVYDGKTKKMVWTGWATQRTGSKPATAEEMQDTVRRILDRFPNAR